MLSSSVLVLNRSYVPIQVTTLKHAICLLYRGIAKVVDRQFELFDFDSWQALSAAVHEEKIGIVGGVMRVPRVILLQLFDRVPSRPVRFSRANIYLRDHSTCQYCRKNYPRPELTLDHVVPVSQGGKSTWDNVVCCCLKCNLKKGGRTPVQAGMNLLKAPVRPNWSLYYRLMARPAAHDDWKPFLTLTDFSYWNVELKP